MLLATSYIEWCFTDWTEVMKGGNLTLKVDGMVMEGMLLCEHRRAEWMQRFTESISIIQWETFHPVKQACSSIRDAIWVCWWSCRGCHTVFISLGGGRAVGWQVCLCISVHLTFDFTSHRTCLCSRDNMMHAHMCSFHLSECTLACSRDNILKHEYYRHWYMYWSRLWHLTFWHHSIRFQIWIEHGHVRPWLQSALFFWRLPSLYRHHDSQANIRYRIDYEPTPAVTGQ